MKFWTRHKEWLWLTTAVIIALGFSGFMIFMGGFFVNVGFLLLGALVAMFTVLLSETIRRPTQARDLARALYEELADRVARCCFDCEEPWRAYLDQERCKAAGLDSFRLRKFSPAPPLIYPSTAGQLAMLSGDAPQAVIQFYYRLAALERDLENIAAESRTERVAAKSLQFLAQRAFQTLAPGLRALEALASFVDGCEGIEKLAIAGYDETRPSGPVNESLRQRLRTLIGQR